MPRGGRRKGVPTLRDVALDAGVSIATASRALNNGPRGVTDDHRRRVLASAAKLNYSINVSAQSVARGRSHSIALVVSDISDPYFSGIASGVFRAAEAARMLVTVAVSERRFEEELSIVSLLRGRRPASIIIVGSRSTDERITAQLVEELEEYEAEGGHAVLVSQSGLPFDTIEIDNESGAHDLASHLIEIGYGGFAVLAGPRDLRTAQDRLAGLGRALAEHGLTLESGNVVHGDFTRDGGYAAAGEFLTRYTGAEVIMAANDVMALGAMARLRESGVSIPHDIAVAGFDDIKPLRDVNLPLTTFHIPLDQVGEAAVGLALSQRSEEPVVREIRGETMLRESTPPRPPGHRDDAAGKLLTRHTTSDGTVPATASGRRGG